MRIGLLGYGKMGHEIESIALQRKHEIGLKIDENNRQSIKVSDIQTCDVMIDFSTPHSVLENIELVLKAGKPLVIGTTGWHDKIDMVRQKCQEENGNLIYGSNFSVGVNMFFALNRHLGEMMNQYSDYEPSIHEIHHTQKLDAPSGTAITLGKDLIAQVRRKNKWSSEKSDDPSTLAITADRIEHVPGTHIVTYSSDIDTIELKHVAHNRKGFALGAVLAAEWIIHHPGFFEVNQMFNF